MKIPRLRGVIRRRLLVNFRADPGAAARLLPEPFRPKLAGGSAMVGICLIRLEQIRPRYWPAELGLSSENAAHRIAVQWEDPLKGPREGVYVVRRDSTSRLGQWLGGRLFPGVQHAATFRVDDDGDRVSLEMASADGEVAVRVRGRTGTRLPAGSVFPDLGASSAFFQGGAAGWSPGRRAGAFDGIRLVTPGWRVAPLDVEEVSSRWFEDRSRFPAGSLAFDHALVMRDLPHEWLPES